MKKLFAILLVSMFGFAFGCGGATVAPEAPVEDALEAPEAAPEEAPEVAEDAEAME